MALIHCDFFSDVLGISTSICVILPQNTYSQIGMKGSEVKEKYPTLYLLHGLSDDHTIWQRRTSIERYVSDMGLAVVMPNAGRSFYTDMKHGYKYFTYITEELPEIARQFFPLSSKREDNFVAGLSMGGYGAFKAALSFPEKYAAAASLSGVLDMASRVKEDTIQDKEELYNIFGDLNSIAESKNDLLYLAKQVSALKSGKPKLYQCCGTEDFLYEDNQIFKNFIKDTDFDYTYDEGPGVHDWAYWDTQIQKVLNWLPIQK
ncbi:esterase family protein [Clostridium sp. YIM B02515]|uniref:Esterase family protein n=1 Tax=Clostridium rhizosphaerae TaxID=2803861 RepID=A0ABS1TA64_9CLOT|nr:alpha/beta hydrolase family protein [Clostridium rhizosphaerae]MBL4936230.1 esterase family protein [Clostridium rhizosphaerae]